MISTPASYFEERWGSSPDPWDHAARSYERRKYDLTVAALPTERYRHVLEPACGVGLLTARLADRADAVTASDRFARAVEEAAARCRHRPNVDVRLGDVRDGPPASDYDAVVLGECLYYFDATTVADVVRRWHAGCHPGGHVVLVHFRPAVTEHVLAGDDVHDLAADVLGSPLVTVVDPGFRIDVYEAGS